jgi:hypothetical protein
MERERERERESTVLRRCSAAMARPNAMRSKTKTKEITNSEAILHGLASLARASPLFSPTYN